MDSDGLLTLCFHGGRAKPRIDAGDVTDCEVLLELLCDGRDLGSVAVTVAPGGDLFAIRSKRYRADLEASAEFRAAILQYLPELMKHVADSGSTDAYRSGVVVPLTKTVKLTEAAGSRKQPLATGTYGSVR